MSRPAQEMAKTMHAPQWCGYCHRDLRRSRQGRSTRLLLPAGGLSAREFFRGVEPCCCYGLSESAKLGAGSRAAIGVFEGVWPLAPSLSLIGLVGMYRAQDGDCSPCPKEGAGVLDRQAAPPLAVSSSGEALTPRVGSH